MTMWLVGGLDPTGGAGVLRDFVTAGQVAPAVDLRVVVTAWTQQGHSGPAVATAAEPDALASQLRALPAPSVVKLGLVPDAVVDPLLERLAGVDAAVVLDPVLQATDGGWLGASVRGLGRLWARATLVTPNRAEAVAFAKEDTDDVALLSSIASRHGEAAVLLKSGRVEDPRVVVDRLWRAGSIRTIERVRRVGPDPRGTGCALATAIACGLAEGRQLDLAVDRGIAWLDAARQRCIVRGGTAYLPVG